MQCSCLTPSTAFGRLPKDKSYSCIVCVCLYARLAPTVAECLCCLPLKPLSFSPPHPLLCPWVAIFSFFYFITGIRWCGETFLRKQPTLEKLVLHNNVKRQNSLWLPRWTNLNPAEKKTIHRHTHKNMHIAQPRTRCCLAEAYASRFQPLECGHIHLVKGVFSFWFLLPM